MNDAARAAARTRILLLAVSFMTIGAAGAVLAHDDHDWMRVDNFRNPRLPRPPGDEQLVAARHRQA